MPKNNRRASAKQLHSERLKQIRPYVNFDYDLRKPLTAAAKRKIKLYHDEVEALTARPYQVYRPRRRDHLAQVQDFSQHEKKLPGLKVAFVPTDGSHKLNIRFTKEGVVADSSEGIHQARIKLDTAALLKDPIKHVNDRIRGRKEKTFTVQAGRYEIPHSYNRERIAIGVARYVSTYSNPEANNYFGRWLHGVIAYSFSKQESPGHYLSEKAKNIAKGKRKRRNERKRKARDYRRRQ